MSDWITISCNGEPHCRHENGFVQFQGKLYLFGGRRIQAVDIFDPETLTWTSASPPPLEIHHFQPVVVDKQIWLIGTMTGEFPRETPLDAVLIYEPHTDNWIRGPVIPKERRRGAAGCVLHTDGWIYVVGGIVDGHHSGTQSWFDRINPATGEWQILPSAPNKRDHAPCAIVQNKLYFLGGRETGRHNGTNYKALFDATIGDVDIFDFQTSLWSTHHQQIPVQTAAGGIGVINERMYYVGGESGRKQAFSNMQIFSPDSDQWTEGAPLNHARHGTNCCVHDQKLWIAAGSGAQGGEPELNSIECIKIE